MQNIPIKYFKAFCWDISSSINPEIGRSDRTVRTYIKMLTCNLTCISPKGSRLTESRKKMPTISPQNKTYTYEKNIYVMAKFKCKKLS